MLRNKWHFYTGLSAIGVISIAFPSPTIAAIATFDSFSEGFSATTITDGGVTFFNLEQRSPALLSDTFSIESTTEDYLGSLFSPPNYLTFGGFAEGPEASFGPFGSVRITTGEVAESASLEVFTQLFSPSNNILTLEAFLNGNLVTSNTTALADFEVIGTDILLYQTLTVSGVTFDELRLVASGPEDNSVAFIGIDNVRINNVASVPESTSALSVLAFTALSAGSILKRKQK